MTCTCPECKSGSSCVLDETRDWVAECSFVAFKTDGDSKAASYICVYLNVDMDALTLLLMHSGYKLSLLCADSADSDSKRELEYIKSRLGAMTYLHLLNKARSTRGEKGSVELSASEAAVYLTCDEAAYKNLLREGIFAAAVDVALI